MIPPEKLQLPFRIVFVMITATMFGMVGWSVHAAGGAGILMSTPATGSGSTLSWAAVFGLQSIVGSQASGCLGQSDWTRYARTPNAALFGQFICAPIFIVVTSVCGIIITSAAASIYGEYIWNPFELLLTVQAHSMSPAARAGTFFAGLGFLVDQLALCQMLNGISTGMDMAALCPKWINIRRGCYILTVIAIAICPWNYVTNPGTFITVLSGWSVFLSPMTGIVVSDYFLVRRGQYHIGDMYMGNSRSAYWYNHGFNWRCFLAWVLGMAPLLRKCFLIILSGNRNCSASLLATKDHHINPYRSRLRTRHSRALIWKWVGSFVPDFLFLWVLCCLDHALASAHDLPHGKAAWHFTIRAGSTCGDVEYNS